MFHLLIWGLLAALLRLLRAHLAVANEAGSPTPEQPFAIADPSVAQALYGWLDESREADHYSFESPPEAQLRPILLLLASWHQQGLRASFTLYGPGLPAEGLSPRLGEQPMTIAGREYVLAQSNNQPLVGGRYTVVVRRERGRGAYAFCIGTREGSYADEATRARVEAIIAGR